MSKFNTKPTKTQHLPTRYITLCPQWVEVAEPGNSSMEEVAGLFENKTSIYEVTQMEMALVIGQTESKRSGRARSRGES